jgi:hypothetical protein
MLYPGDGVTLKRGKRKAVVVRLVKLWTHNDGVLSCETAARVHYRDSSGNAVELTVSFDEIINAGPVENSRSLTLHPGMMVNLRSGRSASYIRMLERGSVWFDRSDVETVALVEEITARGARSRFTVPVEEVRWG